MTPSITLKVFCLAPYRPQTRCKLAPLSEPAFFHREIVLAFKNGRAVHESQGGYSYKTLVRSIASACQESPLAQQAADALWVPVPRSGASEPSFDPQGDKYPCNTLAQQLASRIGGRAIELLDPCRTHRPKKHDVAAGIATLRLTRAVPASTSNIYLIDDTFVTGATIVACAHVLREHGYRGEVAAFCVGYDVGSHEATMEHRRKVWREIQWTYGSTRPQEVARGSWGPE